MIGRKIEREIERKGVDAKTTRCIPPGICFCVYLLPAGGNGTIWRWLANVGVVFVVEVFMMMMREEREGEVEQRLECSRVYAFCFVCVLCSVVLFSSLCPMFVFWCR